MRVMPKSYIPNFMLCHSPDLAGLYFTYVDCADGPVCEEFLGAGQAGSNSTMAVRMCSILHLGPLKKLLRSIRKFADYKSPDRSSSFQECLPVVGLKLPRLGLVSCGVGQVCRPAVLPTVELEAVMPPPVASSQCHRLRSP